MCVSVVWSFLVPKYDVMQSLTFHGNIRRLLSSKRFCNTDLVIIICCHIKIKTNTFWLKRKHLSIRPFQQQKNKAVSIMRYQFTETRITIWQSLWKFLTYYRFTTKKIHAWKYHLVRLGKLNSKSSCIKLFTLSFNGVTYFILDCLEACSPPIHVPYYENWIPHTTVDNIEWFLMGHQYHTIIHMWHDHTVYMRFKP